MKRERGLIHYVPGNIMTLEFDTCFDLILMGEVIEHVAHPDLFLKKIAQMVKPGGYIIMTTPNGGYFLNKLPKFSEFSDPSQFEAVQFQPNADGHIFLLHLDEVEKLSAEAGLEIRETRLFNNSLTIGHIKLRTALKFLPRQWVDRCEKVTASLPLHLTKKLHHSMIVLLAKLSV
jgi:2-polyprenyl-6-hydroxyphenyl methylase/3-demethylubiquinone-9 3-methyltransferase